MTWVSVDRVEKSAMKKDLKVGFQASLLNALNSFSTIKIPVFIVRLSVYRISVRQCKFSNTDV